MDKSEVYFIKINELNKIKDLLPNFDDRLGIKVHFGEEGNVTYIPAKYIKEITDMLDKPTFIETSVLYKSPRSKATTHRELARRHGFDFLPINFIDGEMGDDVLEIDSIGKLYQKVYLGKGLENYNSLLVISHFKGHMASGFGGALKNLGMGLAARRGKLAQHASIQHQVKEEKCVSCGTCIDNCPVNAINFNDDKKAEINQDICIGCSKCISVCPESAIRIPWSSTDNNIFQERMAEYAANAIQNKKCFFINFLINITRDCDCINKVQEPLTPDICILASSDPVAIDQASYDLVLEQFEEFKEFDGEIQLKYGEELGLGKGEYELINL
ncbi:DUF362 domain-containing protein [Patescibacteria group bacterium]